MRPYHREVPFVRSFATNAQQHAPRRFFAQAFFALLLLLGGAWSPKVLAYAGSCDLAAVGATSQDGTPGQTLNFSYNVADNNCDIAGGTVDNVSITSDSSGEATIVSGASYVGNSGTTGFSLKLGSTVGEYVIITVQCQLNCAGTPNDHVTFFARIPANPQMALSKVLASNADEDGSGTVTVGDTLTYTSTATNTGNVPLTNVSIGDPLTTPNSATCAAVAISGACALTGIYVVTAADLASGYINNTATATASQFCGDGCDYFNASLRTRVFPSPSMSVSKVLTRNTDGDHSGDVTLGDTLLYTVTASNTGQVPLTNVQVNDPLTSPATTTCSTVQIGGSCNLVGSYTVTATDVHNGSISNTGTATANGVSGTLSSNPVTTDVFGSKALGITKVLTSNADNDGSGTVTLDDVLTFTVTATNTGTVALDEVDVSDPLTSPGTKNCYTVPTGGTCVLTGTYTVTAGDVANGVIVNTGTATAPGFVVTGVIHTDSTSAQTPNGGLSVSTTLRTPVVTNPGMTVTKAMTNNADGDGSGTVTAGDVLTYTVTATNTGNVALINVVVSDPLTTPDSTTCASVATGTACVLTGTYTVASTDTKHGVIDNTGSARANQISGPRSITIHTPVNSSPQVSVVKTLTGNTDGDHSGTVTLGDVLTYTVTATNTGDVSLHNVQVNDPLTTPNAKTCNNLAVGGTCALNGTYKVTATDVANHSISNTGNATSTELPSAISSNTLITSVHGTQAMSVAKVLSHNADGDASGSVTLGDVLTYTITGTNTGEESLSNIEVNDPMIQPNTAFCPTLAVGATCVLTGTYTVAASDVSTGYIDNTGSAYNGEGGSIAIHTTLHTQVFARQPAMTVVKALTGNTDGDHSGTVTEGDVLTYTVTMTNTGNVPLTNAVVSDPLTTPNSATCATVATGGTCVLTGTYTVTATDTTNGTIGNTGSAVTDQVGTMQSNTVNTTVTASTTTAMTVVKTLGNNADGDHSGSVTIGDVLTYTVTMTNTGNVTLTNVHVGDPLTTPNSATCATVAAGGTCVLTGTYTVTSDDAATGKICNTGSAVADQIDGTVRDILNTPVSTVVDDRTISIEDGNNQSGPPGTQINLEVDVYNGSTQANDVTINWAVASGTATLANPTSSVVGGGSSNIVTLGATPGKVTITATRADDPTKHVTFCETITGTGTPVLTIVSGDSQSGVVGSHAPQPLVVHLVDADGNPSEDETVNWQVISGPAVLDSDSSGTGDGGQDAQLGFSFGTSTGDSVIRASFGTVSVDFHASTLGYQITILSGNGQSAAPGQSLPQDFSVAVSLPAGVTTLSTHGPSTQSTTQAIVGLSNVPVQWQILGGGGSLSQGGNTTTDSSGHSSNHYTLGAGAGLNQVQVSVPGGTSVTFSATSVAPTAAVLQVVSGSGQSLTTNTASAPLVVELTSNGVPVPNATIAWTANNATLGATTSLTDSNGRASNTASVKDPGTATVTASSTSPSASPVSFGLSGGIANLPGLTPQQTQVANAFDHACPALAALSSPTPAQQDLLAQCDALAYAAGHDPDEARNALNEMFFDVSFLETSAAMLISTEQFDNIKARIAALRSGTGGSHFGGLAFASPDGTLPIGSLGESMLGAADGKNDKKQEVGSDFDRWGFFASGTFGNGSADPRQVTPGFGFHTNGLTAGVDYRFSDKLIFGVSAGYAKYSSNVDAGRGGMDTHGWSLSAYSTFFHQDSWYLDGVFTYGSNTYDITRDIVYTLTTSTGTTSVNQVAASNSNGSTLAGALTFGRDFVKGPWSFGPYFRGTYTKISFDGSQEVLLSGLPGNGLGFAIESRDLKSLASVLGAKLNYVSSQSWGVMMPHAEVEWEHEFEDSPDSLTARFLQDPTATPLQVKGDSIDTDFFRLGLGVSFVFTHGRSGFIYYEKTLGRTGITQDNIALGMRLEF